VAQMSQNVSSRAGHMIQVRNEMVLFDEILKMEKKERKREREKKLPNYVHLPSLFGRILPQPCSFITYRFALSRSHYSAIIELDVILDITKGITRCSLLLEEG